MVNQQLDMDSYVLKRKKVTQNNKKRTRYGNEKRLGKRMDFQVDSFSRVQSHTPNQKWKLDGSIINKWENS